MIVMPAMALACWLYLRGRYGIAGFVLALCTVKPQLCFLLIAWLALRSFDRERRGFLIAFAATLGTLIAASELWLPGCFRAWLAAARYYSATEHIYLAFGFLAVPVLIFAAYALYRERNFGTCVAIVLSATIAANPIDPWIAYNYLLLIPAVLPTKTRSRSAL